MNDVIKLLNAHRSIRKFTDQAIPQGLLRELIQAGQAAATSSHVQAYTVIHVKDAANREAIAELAGGQGYVASSAAFLVFCADMKRPTEASERTGANVERGMTEQLLVATVDTALMAQNVAVAAESEGLGICYIGGIRNNPEAVSELLRLPAHVYPVFGMCLGYMGLMLTLGAAEGLMASVVVYYIARLAGAPLSDTGRPLKRPLIFEKLIAKTPAALQENNAS